jgi:DNA-directed RNA polymerase subunit alpha
MTTLDLTGLVRPHVVEMTKREDAPNAAEFRLQPLERGYGYTLGNSLRRMLLSSLRGAAVWAFRLDGVVHEHQTIPGVVEDVHQIIQRLKQLTLVLAPDAEEAVLQVRRDHAGPVYARDIEPHGAVTIVSPDLLLFTLQDDREIGGELYVNKGRGYVEAEQHPLDRSMPVDTVRIDSIYNPVRRANFTVAETRVGQRTDYDRLTLTVETNGTISPEDAVAYAAALAQEHFRFFVDFGKVPMIATEQAGGNGGAGETSALRELLSRTIDDVGLSVRSVNSLKNSNIRTLADLVQYREEDLLKVKNVGEKALGEIAELLRRQGLNFGMKLEEVEGEVRVVDPGTAPQALPTSGEFEAEPGTEGVAGGGDEAAGDGEGAVGAGEP